MNALTTEQLSLVLGYNYTQEQLNDSGMVGVVTFSSGDKLPNVPKNQYTVVLDYTQPLGNSGRTLLFGLSGAYRDSVGSTFSHTDRNYMELDAYWLWNGVVKIEADDWEGFHQTKPRFNASG